MIPKTKTTDLSGWGALLTEIDGNLTLRTSSGEIDVATLAELIEKGLFDKIAGNSIELFYTIIFI